MSLLEDDGQLTTESGTRFIGSSIRTILKILTRKSFRK